MRLFSFNFSKFIIPVPNIESLIPTSAISAISLAGLPSPLSAPAPLPPIAVTGGNCEASHLIEEATPAVQYVMPVLEQFPVPAPGPTMINVMPIVGPDTLAQFGVHGLGLVIAPALIDAGGPEYVRESVQLIGSGPASNAVLWGAPVTSNF